MRWWQWWQRQWWRTWLVLPTCGTGRPGTLRSGQGEERVLEAGLVHPQLAGHDLVAGQRRGDRVERVAVARDHHDIAPVDDAGDIGQAFQQAVGQRHRRAELDPL